MTYSYSRRSRSRQVSAPPSSAFYYPTEEDDSGLYIASRALSKAREVLENILEEQSFSSKESSSAYNFTKNQSSKYEMEQLQSKVTNEKRRDATYKITAKLFWEPTAGSRLYSPRTTIMYYSPKTGELSSKTFGPAISELYDHPIYQRRRRSLTFDNYRRERVSVESSPAYYYAEGLEAEY